MCEPTELKFNLPAHFQHPPLHFFFKEAEYHAERPDSFNDESPSHRETAIETQLELKTHETFLQ